MGEHLSPKAMHLLVQPKEDLSGKNKWQQIQRCFPMTGLHDMRQGVLWAIETDPEYQDTVMASPLFYNPYSHGGWLYANQNSCSVA
jgi:hypothetical protein